MGGADAGDAATGAGGTVGGAAAAGAVASGVAEGVAGTGAEDDGAVAAGAAACGAAGDDAALAAGAVAGADLSALLPTSRERAGSWPSSGETTTIETRRLAALPSVEVLGATGWYSPNPAPTIRVGSIPAATNRLTTEIARVADRSQFESNWALWIGTLSVLPSTSIG